MNEIEDAIAILKARWPEVLLMLFLNLLFSLVHRPLQEQVKEYPLLGLTVLVLILALIVIIVMLPIGFYHSVHLEGQKRQSPLALLRFGKHFFWRTIGVGLVLMFAHLLLAWLVFLAIRQPLAISTSFWKTAQTDPLVYFGCYGVSQLVLIKPTLLILPIVIVTDCRISANFRLLKRFRLSEAQGLVLVFITFTALTLVWAFLPPRAASQTTSHYVMRIPLSLIQHLIGLMMGIMAIRFVGSHNLTNDTAHDLPDLGGAPS